MYMSLHMPDYSLYYLRSMWHDIRELHRLVHVAGKNINSSLTCLKTVKLQSAGWMRPLGKLALVVAIIGTAMTLYLRGRDTFSVTRKLR